MRKFNEQGMLSLNVFDIRNQNCFLTSEIKIYGELSYGTYRRVSSLPPFFVLYSTFRIVAARLVVFVESRNSMSASCCACGLRPAPSRFGPLPDRAALAGPGTCLSHAPAEATDRSRPPARAACECVSGFFERPLYWLS